MQTTNKPLSNCEIIISSGSIQVKGFAIDYGKPSFVVCSKELSRFRNELTRDEMKEFLKIQFPKIGRKDIEVFMAEYPEPSDEEE